MTGRPLAVDDVLPQAPSGATVIPPSVLLANDTNPCSATTVTVVLQPAAGSVTTAVNGSLVYTPPAPPQDATFTYELLCGNLVSRANVTLQAPNCRCRVQLQLACYNM